MREHKFRAWDDKNKKWAFKDFNLLGEVMLFDLLGQYKLEEHCELLVEQFTGLKDVNGKDIYEGDIVLAPDLYERGDESYDDGLIEVYFNQDILCWMGKDNLGVVVDLYDWMYDFKSNSELKIISNIHEKQELLEGDNEATL